MGNGNGNGDGVGDNDGDGNSDCNGDGHGEGYDDKGRVASSCAGDVQHYGRLGWKLLSPGYCLGVARSNSITVTAVILSLTAVIFVRVTKLLSPKNWTVIYSITVLYYCPTVLLLLCYCRTVLLSITVYIA